MKRILLAAFSILALACEQRDQLKDTSKNTKQMNESTQEMNTSTKEMNASTKELNKAITMLLTYMSDMNTAIQGMGKQMTDMNGTMKGMGGQMTEMNGSMKGMSGQLTDMNGTMTGMDSKIGTMTNLMQGLDSKMRGLTDKMDEIYESARPALAKILRGNARAQLDKADSIAGKLAAAGFYKMAFEFQLWANKGLDTPQKRIALATEAAKEFYREVQDYFPRNGDIKSDWWKNVVGRAITLDNSQNSLNALATTMHITYSKQEDVLAADRNVKKMTLLSMTEEALRARQSIQSGQSKVEDYPAYVKEILFYDKVAIYLLNTRVKFLTTVSVGLLSPLQSRMTLTPFKEFPGLPNAMQGLPTGYLETLFGGWLWDFDIAKHNRIELSEISTFLAEAKKAKDLLVELNELSPNEFDLNRVTAKMAEKLTKAAANSQMTVQQKSVVNGLAEQFKVLTN